MFNCLCFLQGWQVWFVPSEAVPVSCPPSGFSPPHPLPAAIGCDVSGASLRGRLQLHSLQQLCPILLPHAPLHQRTPTHMRTTTRVPFTYTAQSVEEMERSPSLPVYSPVADPVALINLSERPCVWDSIDFLQQSNIFPRSEVCCTWRVIFFLKQSETSLQEPFLMMYICIFRERQGLLIKGALIF